MPDGLITAIHYAGTPNLLPSMNTEMRRAMGPVMQNLPGGSRAGGPLSFAETVVLGAIAGFTIFLGLPVARMRRVSVQTMSILNALAIGILVYLIVEIAGGATAQFASALHSWRLGGPLSSVIQLAGLYVAGLLIGLVGLGMVSNKLMRRDGGGTAAERPIVLAGMVAVGIGAHNFAEGLAIGASAATGATAIALSLIVGFGLHNATEGFAVSAPMTGRLLPSWPQLIRLGLIAGGPTFVGTLVGYELSSPQLNVFFLTIAVGALIYVVGELWSILRRHGLTVAATTMLAVGFVVAFATEMFLDLNGG